MSQETKVCENAKEDSLWTMVRDFYNMKNLPFVIVVWAMGIIIIAGAVWSAIEFFKTEDVRVLVMYAVIFICCVTWMNTIKIFAWMTIHRNGLKRQIRKLEDRVDDLSRTVRG